MLLQLVSMWCLQRQNEAKISQYECCHIVLQQHLESSEKRSAGGAMQSSSYLASSPQSHAGLFSTHFITNQHQINQKYETGNLHQHELIKADGRPPRVRICPRFLPSKRKFFMVASGSFTGLFQNPRLFSG